MASKSRHYHHGDLKRELIRLSLARLQAGGLEALSLRKIAAEAGVNHTAAYAHFPTKDALIAAVLEWGYDTLADTLESGVESDEDPVSRLIQMGLIYHSFCRDYSELFFLMMGPRINKGNDYPELERALQRAYAFILGPIEDIGAKASLGAATAPAFWASLQGFLAQILTARVKVRPDKEVVLVEDYLQTLCRGFDLA
ncbi:MAG: TetR/AcrR family transcriptional regulator [Pseudomonadota bacterium]